LLLVCGLEGVEFLKKKKKFNLNVDKVCDDYINFLIKDDIIKNEKYEIIEKNKLDFDIKQILKFNKILIFLSNYNKKN
jgi:hypothetical protein